MLRSCASSVISGGTRLLTGLHVSGTRQIATESSRVYFANHTSHIDFLVVWSSLPHHLRRRTHPVAACDYWTNSHLRRYFAQDVFDSVFIDRGCAPKAEHVLQPIFEILDRGESLILFPEGTRGAGDGLAPFRSGIFHIARDRPHIDLVPVRIGNADRIMPKGTRIPLPLLCEVTFGSPLRIQPEEEKEAFLGRLGQSLLRLRGE